MNRRGLARSLIPPFVFSAICVAAVIGWQAGQREKRLVHDLILRELSESAHRIQIQARPYFDPPQTAALDSLADMLAQYTPYHITFISVGGYVVGDSHLDPPKFDNLSGQPEIRNAIVGREQSVLLLSTELGGSAVYFAGPVIAADGRHLGGIRLGQLISNSKGMGGGAASQMWWAVAAMLVALLPALYAARRLKGPLAEMREVVEGFGRGDLKRRIPKLAIGELNELGETLNRTAGKLDNDISLETQRREELEAVLSSMVEGMLVVDLEGRLIRINRSAREWLNADAKSENALPLADVMRHPELLGLMGEILEGGAAGAEREFAAGNERILQAHGAPLKNAGGKLIGALAVLNDVTRLRRLEAARRDFAANVSHELRTPITALKGFVETLQEVANDDPAARDRFLEIMARHIERLNSIVEDLLALAAVEQSAGSGGISKSPTELAQVVSSAVESCLEKAREREVTVAISVLPGIKIEANGQLIERALVNLIDNALTYNHRGGNVDVSLALEASAAVITVADDGPGIEVRHLERIFERFYRVDLDRSRKAGGTGLGLAIVKHIAEAHRGRVLVESRVGEGSRFKIVLPLWD